MWGIADTLRPLVALLDLLSRHGYNWVYTCGERPYRCAMSQLSRGVEIVAAISTRSGLRIRVIGLYKDPGMRSIDLNSSVGSKMVSCFGKNIDHLGIWRCGTCLRACSVYV